MPSETAARMLDEAGEIQRYILLQAGADGGPVGGRLWLQIMMYKLALLYGPVAEDAGYRPGGLGPHSDAVDGGLERLVRAGLLSDDDGIVLTPEGREAAAGLAGGGDPEAPNILWRNKQFIGRMSRDELLTFVYCAYPDMTVRSDEYRRLWPGRERLVLSMIDGGRMTSGFGAELLGIGLVEMREKIRENGTLRLYHDENDHL